MQARLIFQYPEFLAAALLSVLFLRYMSSPSASLSVPGFLRQPAASIVGSLPGRYIEWLLRMQNWCGWRANHAFADLCAIKIGLWLAALLSVFFIPVWATLTLCALAFFLADLLLIFQVKRRQREIGEALPRALDLMVLCVDAGLGLDAALQRVAADASSSNHALNDELASLGRDILLGMERERAYQELFGRTGVDELKMLACALNQSAKMGLSIARILRAQSEFLRSRQQQHAEEKAAKLPIWMSFPLWFCVMPALMFVIMGPSLITFLENLAHVKPSWF